MLIYLKWICFGVWLDKKQWIKIFATAHIFIKIWDVKTGERSGRGGGGGVIMVCSLWLFEKYLCSVFFNDAISLLKIFNWYIKIFQISNPQDVVLNPPPLIPWWIFWSQVMKQSNKILTIHHRSLIKKIDVKSKILIKIIFLLLPLQRRRQLFFLHVDYSNSVISILFHEEERPLNMEGLRRKMDRLKSSRNSISHFYLD